MFTIATLLFLESMYSLLILLSSLEYSSLNSLSQFEIESVDTNSEYLASQSKVSIFDLIVESVSFIILIWSITWASANLWIKRLISSSSWLNELRAIQKILRTVYHIKNCNYSLCLFQLYFESNFSLFWEVREILTFLNSFLWLQCYFKLTISCSMNCVFSSSFSSSGMLSLVMFFSKTLSCELVWLSILLDVFLNFTRSSRISSLKLLLIFSNFMNIIIIFVDFHFKRKNFFFDLRFILYI